MKNFLQIKHHALKQKTSLLLAVGMVAILVILISVFKLRTATYFQTSAIEKSTAINSTSANLSVPTTTATATSTPTPAEASPLVQRLTVTPPADGRVITLTTTAGSTGWTSDLDGRSHFNMPVIHAGMYQGHTYYGLLQFDLSAVPAGSRISYASMELIGLDDARLGPAGSWQLSLLEAEADQLWPDLEFEGLAKSPVVATVPLAKETRELAPDQATRFTLGRQAIDELERRMAGGTVSFRLEGPTSGEDNLFSWDSGHRKQPDENRLVILSLVVFPPTTPVEDTPSGYVIVTSTPTPDNIITAAAMAAEATQLAEAFGTATPVPANWVTPVIIVPQPTPVNQATALLQKQEATARAFLFGPATATPPNIWTATPTATRTKVSFHNVAVRNETSTKRPKAAISATPTPTATATPVYIKLQGEVATPWVPPSPSPTPTPVHIPSELVGKIAFLSNRSGGPQPLSKPLIYLIDPDGNNLAVMTGRAIYEAAIARESFSSDQRFRVFVKDALRFDNKMVPALYFYDYLYDAEEQITHFGAGAAWDPVWSPTREQIAFVSNDSSNDEVWVINRDGTEPKQLTESNVAYNGREIGKDTFIPEINGQPSWSPDGSQLVFWSNRTGHRQIWVMDADGSDLYSLSTTSHEDWNPVWIKYTDSARSLAPQ